MALEIEINGGGYNSDRDRILYTYDKWECYKAGLYESKKEGMSHDECEDEFKRVLSNQDVFAKALDKLIIEWKFSCEHYLTNKSMNRIAWLGQAAVCYNSGVPSRYSSSWFDISEKDRDEANETALIYLNKWLSNNNMSLVDYKEAANIGKQVELY